MLEVPALPDVTVTGGGPLDSAEPGGAIALTVLPAGEDERFTHPGAARAVEEAYGIDLAPVGSGAPGTAQPLDLPALRGGAWSALPRRIILAGVGDGSPVELRRAGEAIARAAAGLPSLVVVPPPGALRPFIEGLLLPSWRMPRLGATDPAGKPPCPRLVQAGDVPGDVVARARTAVWGTFLARTLAATPSNTKSPPWLAERAAELVAAEDDPRLVAEVHDEDWLAAHGFRALLGVARGSAHPARLVVVRYQPRRDGKPIVLVGKGITYDTGGLSLKQREAMVPMKTDMAGAAVVLAAVLAARRLGVPQPVVAVLALAENALGAASQRPGDVVRTLDGTTVEVLNTDAEGRMVLADALAWARAELRPAALIDVATLTGAATVGLGRHHGALYATDDALATTLEDAGAVEGEALWRMPLVEDYLPALRSDVADLAHIATNDRVRAGSVIAALFLRHFVGDLPWAHLDIAGPARAGVKTPEVPAQGPTGFGVRLLVEWLAARAAGAPASA